MKYEAIKYKEIKNLEVSELQKRLVQVRQGLFQKKAQNKIKKLAHPVQLRYMRRDIARLSMALALKKAHTPALASSGSSVSSHSEALKPIAKHSQNQQIKNQQNKNKHSKKQQIKKQTQKVAYKKRAHQKLQTSDDISHTSSSQVQKISKLKSQNKTSKASKVGKARSKADSFVKGSQTSAPDAKQKSSTKGKEVLVQTKSSRIWGWLRGRKKLKPASLTTDKLTTNELTDELTDESTTEKLNKQG